MKINMYQDVPENFHNQLLETLDKLPEEKRHKSSRCVSSKKWIVLAAAAVLAFGTMTAVATGIFKWNKEAKERFGVTDEQEDKLTMDGVSRQENMYVQENGVAIQLLQSVRTKNSCYYLCKVTLPEGIAGDEDTIFENVDVETDVELDGCVASFVSDSWQNNKAFLEIQLLTDENIDYEGKEAVLRLSNLVQTQKTEIVDVLLEGEWEIPVNLLGDTEETIFEVGQSVRFGGHELQVHKVQAGPFHLRIYMDKEESLHALMFYSVVLTGVQNKDGSLINEDMCINRTFHMDEDTEEFYYEVSIDKAIIPEEISGLIFNNGEVELSLLADDQEQHTENIAETAEDWRTDEELSDNVVSLYEKYGNAVLTDGSYLYLYDITCGRFSSLLELGDLSYDQNKGGEIVPFSTTMVYILPYKGCDTVYVYELTENEQREHTLSSMPAESVLESESYRFHRENML